MTPPAKDARLVCPECEGDGWVPENDYAADCGLCCGAVLKPAPAQPDDRHETLRGHSVPCSEYGHEWADASVGRDEFTGSPGLLICVACGSDRRIGCDDA